MLHAVDRRGEIEQWFIRQGVPHFIEGYRATTGVWTRAFPVLGVLFVVGVVSEFGLTGPAALAAVIGGCVIFVLAWALSNRIRRRPRFALPDDIRTPELMLFVLAPAAIHYATNRQVSGSFLSIVIALALLAFTFTATSYGLIAISWFVLRHLGRQLRLIGDLSSRALPLLLLVTMTIFITGETWQMSSRLVGVSQFATVGLFVLLGGLFLLTRTPTVVRSVTKFATWDEVSALLLGTPAEGIHLPSSPPEPDPFSLSQRINIRVIAVTRQAIQITLISLTAGLFYLFLGFVAIHPATAGAWLGAPPHILFSASLGKSTFAITSELVRVASFLAAFAGLTFTVYLVTDQTYREEFSSDVSQELRQVIAVRLAYHAEHAKPV
jgi:hypothetical protein